MLKYILKRILFFIPTLIIISLLAFLININAPGDPIDRLVTASSNETIGSQNTNMLSQRNQLRKKLGLDLPVFYIGISNAATPDTLYKIYDDIERTSLERLINQYGNWGYISAWYNSLLTLQNAIEKVRPDTTGISTADQFTITDSIHEAKFTIVSLRSSYVDQIINARLATLSRIFSQYAFFQNCNEQLQTVKNNYEQIKQNPSAWKKYIPAVRFHGNNQYHRWIFGDGNWLTGKHSSYSKGIIRGDLGLSYETKLPVSSVIADHIRWSILLTLISVVLAYVISIPIGLRSAAKRNSLFDRSSSVILFILYSMPPFWVGTLLLMNFANPDALALFPASGIGPIGGIPHDASFFEILKLRLPYFILPVICYTYAQIAFLSRITRVSSLEVIGQDYIRTARAKGLPEKKVVWRHVLRNTLLPVITVFANVFPVALGGAVLIESIFGIPGMGQEIYAAIVNKDYPVIVDIFTITGVLTLAGFLLADILYAVADPRISYTVSSS